MTRSRRSVHGRNSFARNFGYQGDEFDWLRHRILTNGSQVVIIDVGSFSNSRIADYTSDEVIRAAGESPSDIRTRHNRGEMMDVMGRGASIIASSLPKRENPRSPVPRRIRWIIRSGFGHADIADWIPQAPGFHDGFRRCQPLRGTNRRHTYVLRR